MTNDESTNTKTVGKVDEEDETRMPNWFFRQATLFYADRKLVLLTLMYGASCCVIYAHFGLKKFQSQVEKVPLDAPRYWWKVLVPTFEFGTMHVILFHLALIPLTMCRFTISKLSSTSLNRYFPFHEAEKCHIFLGYAILCLLIATIIGFFTFFGVLCGDGEQIFCDKFRSEIMITGYITFGVFLTIGITSFFRHAMPYKVFYVFHHLFLVVYAATIIHTIDQVQRREGGRSQSYKWLGFSMLLYTCDRASLYFNRRFETLVDASSVALASSCGVKKNIVYLKVLKPSVFHFVPGQYVYIKIPCIDKSWHPFSIASSPTSSYLEFYIETFGEKSWTGKLWDLLMVNVDESISPIVCEIMGPYGTGFGKVDDYSHGLLIGAGTGVVPLFSVLKHHIDKLLNVQPGEYMKSMEKHDFFVRKLTEIECRKKKTSILSHTWSKLKRKKCEVVKEKEEISSLLDMRVTRTAQMTMCQFLPLLLIPPFGMLMFGLTLAWNYLPFEPNRTLRSTLFFGTFLFQLLFFFLSIALQEMHSILNYIDLSVVIISAVSDAYWSSKDLFGRFTNEHIVYYSILMGYMVLRSWLCVLNYNSITNPIPKCNKRRDGPIILDQLALHWITRDASMLCRICPMIDDLWTKLLCAWGTQRAKEFCSIEVYFTNNDENIQQELERELQHYSIFRAGVIKFKRPSLADIISNQAMIKTHCHTDLALKASRTLFVFCGSSAFASTIKHQKLLNDVALLMRNQTHEVDLIVESFGGKSDFSKKILHDEIGKR